MCPEVFDVSFTFLARCVFVAVTFVFVEFVEVFVDFPDVDLAEPVELKDGTVTDWLFREPADVVDKDLEDETVREAIVLAVDDGTTTGFERALVEDVGIL